MTITFGPGSIAIIASAAAISAIALMIALALRAWVLKQDEHCCEMIIAQMPAVNVNVFGCDAVPCVQDVDFHVVPCN